MQEIREIKLIKELPDGTKQYSITSKENKDIRKEIFSNFAKNGITIFELKKAETTLEDAFIGLIDSQKEEKIKTKAEIKKEKQEEKQKEKEEKERIKEEKKKDKEAKKENKQKGGDK